MIIYTYTKQVNRLAPPPPPDLALSSIETPARLCKQLFQSSTLQLSTHQTPIKSVTASPTPSKPKRDTKTPSPINHDFANHVYRTPLQRNLHPQHSPRPLLRLLLLSHRQHRQPPLFHKHVHRLLRPQFSAENRRLRLLRHRNRDRLVQQQQGRWCFRRAYTPRYVVG